MIHGLEGATDETLLNAWRSGDRGAGNRLFQRHFEPIRRFFVNKAGDDIGELVQTTFERCVKATTRFEGRSSFRTFLFAIANNVLREHYRAKLKSERIDDVGEVSLEDCGVGPSTHLRGKREQQLLLRALRRLPLTSQTVLELYFWEGLKGREVAEILGIPEDTARSRIRNGKKRLRQVIEQVAEEPQVGQSTAGDIEGWAAAVRAEMVL